jgi:hypothetical protein
LSLIFSSGEAACSNNATGDDPVQALEKKAPPGSNGGLWDARSCHEAAAYPRWVKVSPAMLTPIIALITVNFLERSTRTRKRKREASDGEERTGIV